MLTTYYGVQPAPRNHTIDTSLYFRGLAATGCTQDSPAAKSPITIQQVLARRTLALAPGNETYLVYRGVNAKGVRVVGIVDETGNNRHPRTDFERWLAEFVPDGVLDHDPATMDKLYVCATTDGARAAVRAIPAKGGEAARNAAFAKARAANEAKQPAFRGAGASGGRGTDSWLDRSTFERCITRGMPGAMSPTAYNNNYRITQGPGFVAIQIEMLGGTRVIPTDGRSHVRSGIRQWMGDSVGRWEGNTLVVDTVGFNGYAELDARGQPTSPRLHTVERFTPSADGASIDIATTIDDPEYYSQPFTVQRSWKKSPARHPFEYDCMENPRQEDFENAYYVRERYRPVCMRVEGEGMALSKMVCRRPQ